MESVEWNTNSWETKEPATFRTKPSGSLKGGVVNQAQA